MKIYTKTGDDGTTGLFGGPRTAKDDPRIEAYGAVDELNAALGIARAANMPAELQPRLDAVQRELFDLGSELATRDASRYGLATLGPAHAARLETEIDGWEAVLPPLQRFILPTGTPAAAGLHLARTICRRAERRMISLGRVSEGAVRRELLIYMNRLSDWLFVLARFANHTAGQADTLWESSAAPRQQL